MEKIRRVYVEKKAAFAVEAQGLLADLRSNLGLTALTGLRILNRYDVSGLSEEEYAMAKVMVLSEPPVDQVYEEELPLPEGCQVFAVELLPGQYDQREDFAAAGIQLISQKERPLLAAAKVYILEGPLEPADLARIKAYCINPVEAREAELAKPRSLAAELVEPPPIERLQGFRQLDRDGAQELRQRLGLAMSLEDLLWCQSYFQQEGREPSLTELRVLDTYWSDHCRHTTFTTHLDRVEIQDGPYAAPLQAAYQAYLAARAEVYGPDSQRPVTLMDMAVIGMKKLRLEGRLPDLDQSEEINACSVVVPLEVDGRREEWLLQFKNETHNHPTEIEPFGGAATCLGGAIRDPLSGRAYVYQALRLTGSADPRTPVADTLAGKLPQRKLTIGAAAGYSSYGNQIGLATGQVEEYYHPRFVAKRLEIGAVVGAVPRSWVRREAPQPGDLVVLLGGRTGRDGCGGATGSSKEHNLDSLLTCGAEVQKGNPPTERELQRLFRNPQVTAMIKRCNDFGAGGVSVAIGELTAGLHIDLDKVPKKYEGLDGTELAISESQERMAVVIEAKDEAAFQAAAAAENLEATVVAVVTEEPRLVMTWRGDKIVDIARSFLDTNGVAQHAQARLTAGQGNIMHQLPAEVAGAASLEEAWLANLGRLNVASQKGLAERFDSTIGRGTVLLPFGGRRQLTPAEGMVGRFPVLEGHSHGASVMACGYNPDVACASPFHGAVYAVVTAVARACACGADYRALRLSLQEYFPHVHDAASWGLPCAALLGAFSALDALGLAAIGGKDSMSGTFMDLTVPPTLAAFAVGAMDGREAVSPEFKAAGDRVYYLPVPLDEYQLPDYAVFRRNLQALRQAVAAGAVAAAGVVKEGGLAAQLTRMALGNQLGLVLEGASWTKEELFTLQPGGLLVELKAGRGAEEAFAGLAYQELGVVTAEPVISLGSLRLPLARLEQAYTQPLAKIFPAKTAAEPGPADIQQPTVRGKAPAGRPAPLAVARPRVFIPVFPGINCEYDSAAAFREAGALVETFVVRNLTPAAIEESVAQLAAGIRRAQILMLPGGFSAGDEPDGSGKFIATMLRNGYLSEALSQLLEERDGLILGICNGFQALIKLGLLPSGRISPLTSQSPTLTYNTIGRHVSQLVTTRVVSTLSPWLALCEPGEEHVIAVSHGEGRFYAPQEVVEQLFAAGQVATQYVDEGGRATMESPYNPNGSTYAIEGLTSPDGRILGKMGHSERYAPGLYLNVPGQKEQRLFAAGVRYFQ